MPVTRGAARAAARVGSRGGAAAARAGRRPDRADRRAARAGRHRRAPARPRPRRPAGRPGAVHHRRARPGQARRRRRRDRGGRRHRAGPHLAGRGAARAARAWSPRNKALLAEDGGALHDAAAEGGADLYYEAAVAGAIPLLRPLRESLHGDRITRVTGIVNGTTNFILSAMDATGAGFTEALEEATALGYAEADPTADVEGFDAAAKAAILAVAGLPHPGHAPPTSTARASPRSPRPTWPAPRRWAARSSCSASPTPHRATAAVSVRVHPAMIPRTPPAGRRRRRVQRGLRRGRGGRAADVLRPRRRRRARPRARCSATWSRWPATGSPAYARPSESAYADLPVRPMGEARHPLPRLASTWPTAPACWPRSPGSSPSTTCRIATVNQSGRGDEASAGHRHARARPTRALAATVAELRGLDIVRVGRQRPAGRGRVAECP